MNSSGKSLAIGLMASPLTSIRFSGMICGPSSLGLPSPSKTRPIISGDTPSVKPVPKKRALLSSALRLLVPSKPVQRHNHH